MPTPAPSDAAHVAQHTPGHDDPRPLIELLRAFLAPAPRFNREDEEESYYEWLDDAAVEIESRFNGPEGAHIVRCVNAHDALVSALRSLWDYYCSGLWHDEDDEAIRQNVNRALSLATEGQD